MEEQLSIWPAKPKRTPYILVYTINVLFIHKLWNSEIVDTSNVKMNLVVYCHLPSQWLKCFLLGNMYIAKQYLKLLAL